MQGSSSLTRDQTQALLALGVQSLNHSTTREVSDFFYFFDARHQFQAAWGERRLPEQSSHPWVTLIEGSP